MIPGRRVRFGLSALGCLLWLGYPVAWIAGAAARRVVQCRGKVFTGHFDGICFSDALPVLELLGSLLIWVGVLLFGRFAMALFRERGADDGRMLSLAALFGLVWSFWHWLALPREAVFWPLHVYWAAFAGWFLLGARLAWPRTGRSGSL